MGQERETADTRFVIVPNDLSDAIYEKVDEQLDKVPTLKPNREAIYNDILRYYNEHGVIPEFKLTERT